MTAISPTTSSTNINYTSALTPDALMLYCQSRLRGLDEQMYAQFKKQEGYRALTSKVNDLQQKVTEASNGGFSAQDAVPGCFKAAYGTCVVGSTEYKKLQELEERWNKSTGKQKERQDIATALGDFSKELGSSAELDMINLQSFMSQRQSSIQLTTNLIASLGESLKNTAAKVGA